MDTNNPTPGDQNVERLVGEAYRPGNIDRRFAERTLRKLQELADERKQARLPWQHITWLYVANAAAVLLLIAGPPLFWRIFVDSQQPDQVKRNGKDTPGPTDQLRPRPPGATKELPLLDIGQVFSTSTGQKKKV